MSLLEKLMLAWLKHKLAGNIGAAAAIIADHFSVQDADEFLTLAQDVRALKGK